MRTLKICIIAASLFLFAIPVTAENYPPEMPDIQNAPIQVVCETKTSWFAKLYLHENWQVLIAGHDKKEMTITMTTVKGTNLFVFIPSANEWKNADNLTTKEEEEFEKFFEPEFLKENNKILLSCIESNLRTHGFRQ